MGSAVPPATGTREGPGDHSLGRGILSGHRAPIRWKRSNGGNGNGTRELINQSDDERGTLNANRFVNNPFSRDRNGSFPKRGERRLR